MQCILSKSYSNVVLCGKLFPEQKNRGISYLPCFQDPGAQVKFRLPKWFQKAGGEHKLGTYSGPGLAFAQHMKSELPVPRGTRLWLSHLCEDTDAKEPVIAGAKVSEGDASLQGSWRLWYMLLFG